MQTINPLGSIDPTTFLRDYWQQKPLLVRQAFPLSKAPISKEALGGLACEEDVSSRIVQEHHHDGPWKVDYGPFDEATFAALPDSNWTLLVSDCEKHLPELRFLTEPFHFLPDWRIDDLMISYAADGGSVGPHTDDYDVFLIQLDGVREWQISTHVDDCDIIEDIELKILRTFEPEQSWQLEPGDMLYLPPRVAHYGIARGECMTGSVGFRAPGYRDILQDFLEDAMLRTPDSQRYQDAGMVMQAHPAEITPETIKHFRSIIRDLTQADDTTFRRWLGCFVTEVKTDVLPPGDAPDMTQAAFCSAITGNGVLERNEFSRLAYIAETGSLTLFADKQAYSAPLSLLQDIRHLCEKYHFSLAELQQPQSPELMALLYQLYCNDVLFLSDAPEE